MVEQHPALARLDVLVGRWTVQPKVEGLGVGWTEFAWIEGGQFLRQFSDAEPLPARLRRRGGKTTPCP